MRPSHSLNLPGPLAQKVVSMLISESCQELLRFVFFLLRGGEFLCVGENQLQVILIRSKTCVVCGGKVVEPLLEEGVTGDSSGAEVSNVDVELGL